MAALIRKLLLEFLAALITLVLVVGTLLTPANEQGAAVPEVLRIRGEGAVDLSAGTVTEYENTHGGFHGDGYTFAVVSFGSQAGAQLEAELERTPYWHPLPMPEAVATVVYGGERRTSMVTRDNSTIALFPEMSEGYYYFFDRSSESVDPGDANAIFGRYSYNFSVALYDSEAGLLYYFEQDT